MKILEEIEFLAYGGAARGRLHSRRVMLFYSIYKCQLDSQQQYRVATEKISMLLVVKQC